MLEPILINNSNKNLWEGLLNNAINVSYMNNFSYARTKEILNKKIETYLFEYEKRTSGAHYALKSSINSYIKVADIQAGYLFDEEPKFEMLCSLIEHYIDWAKKSNAIYARINPWFPSKISGENTEYHFLFNEVFKMYGFTPIGHSRHTYWIDLRQSDEEILKNMKRQTRYEIRRQHENIEIQRLDKPSKEFFETFWKLYSNLGKLKGFGMLQKNQLEQEFNVLLNEGIGHLFVLSCFNEVLNVSFASSIGRSAYLYGAMSTSPKNEKSCSSLGQIAQWEMIKFMKSKGVNIYDLGFCPGPIPEKDHPEYKIWRFKYAFGGVPVEYLPNFGVKIKPIRGRFFEFVKYKK